MSTADLILQQTRQLYPTGRAFRMAPESVTEALHVALAVSESDAWNDAASLMDSLLPDSERFTEDDATDWERRLGIATDPDTDLEDRKAAIKQKLQHPGINPAKAHYLYIQQQLQLAGFNVYVWENLDPIYGGGFNYFNPYTLNPNILTDIQHGDQQHGVQSAYLNNVVANSIYNDSDIYFDFGSSLACTFFIGGSPLGTYANVPAERETEFRQLILRLKPVQNIAILFINYT